MNTNLKPPLQPQNLKPPLSSYNTPSPNENKMAISLTQKILLDLEKNIHISSLKLEYIVNKISTDKKLSKLYKEVNSLPFYCYISQKICGFLKEIKSNINDFLSSFYSDLSQSEFLTVDNRELTEIKGILETKNYDDLEAIEEYLSEFNKKETSFLAQGEDEKDLTIVKKQGEINISPYKKKVNSSFSENEEISLEKIKNKKSFGIEDIEEIGNSFMKNFPGESDRGSSYLGDTTLNQNKTYKELFTIKKVKMKFKGKKNFLLKS